MAKNISDDFSEEVVFDFHSLLRLYALTNGSFSNIKKLNDSEFYVTKDEFFKALLDCNIPVDTALDIVKNGIWSKGEKRQSYLKLLETYNVSENIKSYFLNVTHLWTASSCADRLLYECLFMWYKEYFPEIVSKLNK